MTNEQTRVLVTGATGMQGRPIVDALLARGFAVRALTRQHDPNLPPAVEIARGDMDDAASLRAAFQGVDRLVLLLPLVFDVTQVRGYVGNVTEAARAAEIDLIAFDTSAPVPDAPVGVAAVDVKVEASALIAASGLPVVTVRPTIYAGNLAAPWTAPDIVGSRTIAYPLAADVPCAWITWEDAAACVAAAVASPALAGHTFDVGGPEALDGAALAAAFTQARGVEHSYATIPLDAFEAGLNGALGAPVGTEIAALYRWLSGMGSGHLDLARGGRANGAGELGVTLTSVADWAAQVPWEAVAKR